MHEKIERYLATWFKCGYGNDVPDEVLNDVMHEGLAPSYKAIALAILKCDHSCQSLGFSPDVSPWYIAMKRIELAQRPSSQLWLF